MQINHTDPGELLAIVDANDNEIGADRRDIIHRDNLFHRAIHLFVFHTDGRLLLQQRSAKKDRYPLCWECVGGHLGPGETYGDCVFREAEEELGIKLSNVEFICKLSAGVSTDYEFIQVYRTMTAATPKSNPDEIIAWEWLLPREWREEITRSARPFSPTLIHSIEQSKILQRDVYTSGNSE